MIFHQWRRTDQEPEQTRARILAEQEAIAARKKLDACPGIRFDTDTEPMPQPSRFRDDATARRAQALLDLMRD